MPLRLAGDVLQARLRFRDRTLVGVLACVRRQLVPDMGRPVFVRPCGRHTLPASFVRR